jgi:ribosomal protein L11 methyltransferase
MPVSEMLWVLGFEVSTSDEDALAELGACEELNLVTWRNPESDRLRVQLFTDSVGEASALRARLPQLLANWLGAAAPAESAIRLDELKREDWSESWKKFFHVQHITPRLVVKPSWEPYTAKAGEFILELDPGMSFGTGYHGTTRACLEFLDELSRKAPKAAVLDVGCGSGILALAAWKLGFRPVTALDNDPQAVTIALENLALNGVKELPVSTADLYTVNPEPAQIVVANILATVLLANAERLCGFLDRTHGPAYLILSGILHAQYPEIRERFTALGLKEVASRSLDEWTSGYFVAE